MSDYDVTDLVAFALDKQPDQFKTAFDSVMADKVGAALELKKQEVAQNYMSDEEELENSSEETTDETEDEDGQDTEENS